MKILREHFRKLVELAKAEGDITCSHSIEEAEADHAWKKSAREAERTGDKRRKKDKKQSAEKQSSK